MKRLLEAINRGILRGLNEQNIELLADLDDENLDQMDSIQTKTVNNKIDYSIKQQLTDAIQSGKIHNRLKQIINDPANFDKFKGLIPANDKNHLKELIQVGQNLFGDDGNFNWIDTSEITDMYCLFYYNTKFNGHIELWDVSNVTNMSHMFFYAHNFNQPIGDWDVSNVTNMNAMFFDAIKFNRPIGNWDVSNVTNMDLMFKLASSFNQPIGDWNVSNVTNMQQMFNSAESFNQPIGDWDVSNVVRFDKMFYSATQFKQNLGKWNVTGVFSTFTNMFDCSAMEYCSEYLPNTIRKQYQYM